MDNTPDFAGWSTVSKAYNHVERVTLPLSETLIARAHAIRSLSEPSTPVFDNGCGTGVLTLALKKKYPQCSILATDASAGMVDILKARVQEAGYDIAARVLDARKLADVEDDKFTHAFSAFMICLAPDPDQIAKEMYRVTKTDGVLGVAVWADPYFGYFNTPWTKACREVMADYEPTAVMEDSWTVPQNVKAGLEKVGFKDVDVKEERGLWRWESVGELGKYFFEGGNPGNEIMRESFEKRGGDVGEVRPLFEKIVEESYGKEGGYVEAPVLACLVTARK